MICSLHRLGGAQRSGMAYSPPSLHGTNKRRRVTERGFDRGGVDYHYSSSSKRTGESHIRRSPRERRSNSHEKYSSRSYTRSSPSSPAASSSRVISGGGRKRRARSPSPNRSVKRRSRSHSPRSYRAPSPSVYHSRSNQGESSLSSRRSPTQRKMDFSSKISDTSLFAELVKDKQKRSKVLQELFDKKDDGGNSNSNNTSDITIDSSGVIVIDGSDHCDQASDNARDVHDVSLGDIPMPTVGENSNDNKPKVAAMSDDKTDAKSDVRINDGDHKHGADAVDSGMPTESSINILRTDGNNSPILIDGNDSKITTKTGAANIATLPRVTHADPSAIMKNNSSVGKQGKLPSPQPTPVIKATYTINKPKNLTKLPMPPGVNVAELEDISTPSPPRSASPINRPISSSNKTNVSSNEQNTPVQGKKSVLTLPMPAVVQCSEELSDNEDYASSPPMNRNPLSENSANKPEYRRKRPVILNRRNSRSQAIKDWGERCVDVFEVIAQIGEGTYGQVNYPFTSFSHL